MREPRSPFCPYHKNIRASFSWIAIIVGKEYGNPSVDFGKAKNLSFHLHDSKLFLIVSETNMKTVPAKSLTRRPSEQVLSDQSVSS